MSTLYIPLPVELERFSVRPTLDGAEYKIAFDWNDRATRLAVSIFTSADVAIVQGQAARVDMPLFARFADSRLPAGYLMLQDTSGARRAIEELADLGDRVKLVYVPAEDLG
jgi:hypothetical protein